MRIGYDECVNTLLTKRCMSTRSKATLTRGASRQTLQDAEAEAATTVAEAVVLLLTETGDRALSCQDRSARFRTYVFNRCRYVLAFSVLAYSIPAYPYLSFPYLRFPSCNFVLTFSVLAFSVAPFLAIYHFRRSWYDVGNRFIGGIKPKRGSQIQRFWTYWRLYLGNGAR